MGCVQSYFRKAHSAGLSPSSTQASENAGLIPDSPTEPPVNVNVKQALAEKEDAVVAVVTSQDAVACSREITLESNGGAATKTTGLGLGPGVAALAASTGTVAILGATADTTLDAVQEVDVKQLAEEVVKDVQQAAEEVVKDVQQAAEEAVKDANTLATDAPGKAVEDMVERVESVVSEIAQTPEPQDRQTPQPKEEDAVEEDKDSSLATSSPLPAADSKSEDRKDPSSPIVEDNVPAVDPSVPASPVPLAANKEDASLSLLSSLPDDSVASSSIREDAVVSPSSEEKPESLTATDPEVSDVVQVLEEAAANRPTSGVVTDKEEADVHDDTFPQPPPPEVQETTSENAVDVDVDVEEEEATQARSKRSAADRETLDEVETPEAAVKADEGEAASGEVETPEAAVKADEGEAAFGAELSPAAESLEAVESSPSAILRSPNNPQIEVSAPSRPQSSDVDFIIEAERKVGEAIEQAEAETDEAANQETAEEVEAVRPRSAQVEEKAEQVVNEVVQTVTQMVTTAATTIQASFRGHRTRQNLRRIADQDQDDALTDADATLSLDAKSSDTKDDLASETFPPPLDGEPMSTTTTTTTTSAEMDELQPVVHVTISAEPAESRPDSQQSKLHSESEGPTTTTTAPASEQESVEVEEVQQDQDQEAERGHSGVQSESTTTGDSVDAVKGSETNSCSTPSARTSDDQPAATTAPFGDDEKQGAAASTIQASFRGFQARQHNLNKPPMDDTQLPVPEPLQELAFEEVGDEDDLPPPPEECDIDAPPAADVAVAAVETPRSPETGEKLTKPADGEKEDDDEEVKAARKLALLQRPQQCDELPEHRGGAEVEAEVEAEAEPKGEPKGELVNGLPAASSSNEVDDSSLSSAATKIQAGKLLKDTFKDTFSTTDSLGAATLTSDDEPNIGVTAVVIASLVGVDKVAKTVENGVSGAHDFGVDKGLSLDSQLSAKTKIKSATGHSESDDAVVEEDKALQGEMQDAATKIQSNFRGYRTRQRLHRENAVQVTTSSGTPATTSQSCETPPPLVDDARVVQPALQMRSSGEFHDMLVLAPEPAAADLTYSDSWLDDDDDDDDGDDALARRQTSDLGTPLEGHVIDVATPASGVVVVSAMGKARDTTSGRRESCKEMKGVAAKAAATKIQAGFRGYKVRKQMKLQARDKKGGPRRRSSVQLATATTPTPTSQSLQDKSATKIQAGVRGFLVRKRRLEEKNAAVKIQAGFRGYKVRRDVQVKTPPTTTTTPRAPVEK